MFACWELINSPGTGAAQPDGGQRAAETCAESEGSTDTDIAGSTSRAWLLRVAGHPSISWQGLYDFLLCRLPSQAFHPFLAAGRHRQPPYSLGLAEEQRLGRQQGLAPAALWRALVMVGPACRHTALEHTALVSQAALTRKNRKTFHSYAKQVSLPILLFCFSSLRRPKQHWTSPSSTMACREERLVLHLSQRDKKGAKTEIKKGKEVLVEIRMNSSSSDIQNPMTLSFWSWGPCSRAIYSSFHQAVKHLLSSHGERLCGTGRGSLWNLWNLLSGTGLQFPDGILTFY